MSTKPTFPSPGAIREALELPDPKQPPPALPKVGLHFDVPFQAYLDWEILSQSVLKEGRETMGHAKAAFDGARKKKATDGMVLGSAMHAAFLEPAQVEKAVIEWKGGTRRGAGWDAFEAEHAGKAILTPAAYTDLIGMVESLRRHPVVKQWLSKIERVEVSSVGLIESVLMKGRCDALTTGGASAPLVDLKMVTSTNPRAVTKTVMDFGYHIQAAAYRRLFNRERYMLVCVEGSPPYDVVVYELVPAYLRLGEEELASLLQQWRFCLKSGVWPGRYEGVELLEPPAWAIEDKVDFEGAD